MFGVGLYMVHAYNTRIFVVHNDSSSNNRSYSSMF